jgi:phytoene dehydrogenase-like protein
MAQALMVGAGHNGLTCACYLARAGLRTLVLDQYHTDLAVASMPGGF